MTQPAAPASNSRNSTLALACVGVGLCVAAGLWLRAHDLWRPPFYAFDEHHFVDNARVYLQGSQLQNRELAGLVDGNDHPPLGKLWIALGMRLFGDSGLGWRIMPAAFGAASVLWAALLARRLFPGTPAWCFALVFVSLDGFAIAYSRVALLDGMLTSLLLLCFWLLLGTNRASLAAAAVVGGLALAIKFSGICYLGPLAGALLLRSGSGRLRWLLIAPALSLLVYYACYALGLWLLGAPSGPASVWQHTLELIRHHAGLIDMQNPATSSWPTWFIPTRPLLLWRMVEGSSLRLVTSRGNPLLWWFCSASVLGLSGTLLWRGLGPVLRDARFRLWAIELPARSLVFALLCYWSLMAPWILTRRDSYLYHYLPAYLVAVVLVSGLFGALYQRRRRWALALALAVVLVSAGYAPRWAGLPLRAAHSSGSAGPARVPRAICSALQDLREPQRAPYRVQRQRRAIGNLSRIRRPAQLLPQHPRHGQHLSEQRGGAAPHGRAHLPAASLEPTEQRIDLVGRHPQRAERLRHVIQRDGLPAALQQRASDVQQLGP